MIDDENQETRESPAVSNGEEPSPATDEVSFSLREDPGAGGDPITGAGGQSPAAAQERAEAGDESPLDRPEVQILGAFVGAFVLAKLLQKLFSRD